jgi:hypothetical protein
MNLHNSLICAYKKGIFELHDNSNSYTGCEVISRDGCFAREVVVSRGNNLFLSLPSLLHIIKNLMWHCMRRPMGLLTCTNVLALRDCWHRCCWLTPHWWIHIRQISLTPYPNPHPHNRIRIIYIRMDIKNSSPYSHNSDSHRIGCGNYPHHFHP